MPWCLAAQLAWADPAPPTNSTPPTISGTAQDGDQLAAEPGTWNGDGSTITYQYAGSDGQTGSPIALSAADVGQSLSVTVTPSNDAGPTTAPATSDTVGPVGPLPSTTSLLVSPERAVTNQSVTLIATVTSVVTTNTALSGTVTFEKGDAPIAGCANMPVTPSGQGATVACSTSFAASTASLSAVFSPGPDSIVAGSVSPGQTFVVGPDSSSTSLDASPKVNVGVSTTYTATVTPPPSRPGPVEPTGSVEFFDGGQPIASCADQPLTNGGATCTVTYETLGAHSISARYVGDANFTDSSSAVEPVSAVRAPTSVLGTITATMQWTFYYTPSYTKVTNLVVHGVPSAATVLVKCSGRGCPFAHHASALSKRTRCGKKNNGMCFTSGRFNITPGFASRRLAVGTRVTVEIIRPNWIGKYYRFTMRAHRGPRVQIACLAPGGSVPDAGC